MSARVTTPRSIFAVIMYVAAAGYAAFKLIDFAQLLMAYGMLSDHENGFEQVVRVIDALLPAALFLTMGAGLQYLSDIRWLLMNREGADA